MRTRTYIAILFLFWTCRVDAFRVALPLSSAGPRSQRTTQSPTSLYLFPFFRDSRKDEEYAIPIEGNDIPMECDPNLLFESRQSEPMDTESILNVLIPTLTPLIAFLSYEDVAETFAWSIDVLGPGNWVAVDGGEYQARIIAPAINGVVVPAVSILFATLASMTISSLRDRQLQIRLAINMEAGELRALECLLDCFPSGMIKDRAREYLMQYTSRVIAESSHTHGSGEAATNPRRGMDSELNAFVSVLLKQNGNEKDAVPSLIVSEVLSSVSKLREQRKKRITALQSTFPPLHYLILVVLAFSQCTAFMIETSSKSQIFLNALQLKILWSMLTSTFAFCFAVFSDLRTPFCGSYQILAVVDQLYLIRLTLQASVQMDQIVKDREKKGEIEKEYTQNEWDSDEELRQKEIEEKEVELKRSSGAARVGASRQEELQELWGVNGSDHVEAAKLKEEPGLRGGNAAAAVDTANGEKSERR
jgi:hypothetical protein